MQCVFSYMDNKSSSYANEALVVRELVKPHGLTGHLDETTVFTSFLFSLQPQILKGIFLDVLCYQLTRRHGKYL